MDVRVLVRMLQRLVLGDGCQLGSRILRSLADDVESVTLVRDCKETEAAYGTHYTDAIMRGSTSP